MLLGRQAPDEQDAVLGRGRQIRDVVRLVDAAADRDDAVQRDRPLEELGGLARRCRDGARHVEGALRVVPRELEDERVIVFGKMLWSTMLSAITWLVAMIGMPRSRAIRVRPRPTMMCDWMCTTSG